MDKISHLISQVRVFKGWVALNDAEIIERVLLDTLCRSSMYQADTFGPERDLCADGFIYRLSSGERKKGRA